jgi:uncharacterized SAM-binding protein YcdF (DUF218 family)
MFALRELIPIFLSPLVLFGAMVALGSLLRRRGLSALGLVLLWLTSLPVVSDQVWRTLEGDQRIHSPESLPAASAVVVLSGMARLSESDQGPVFEWEQASDRFWAGVTLLDAGKAPVLVFTGGRQPWSPSPRTEGQWLAEQAIRLGVTQDRIRVTDEVRNTSQEAAAVETLIIERDILLVTSAFHMPRAQKIFTDAGFRVTPVPVDFQHELDPLRWSHLLPSAEALRKTSAAAREWIGRVYYGAFFSKNLD